jgi:predicted dehydrogenase
MRNSSERPLGAAIVGAGSPERSRAAAARLGVERAYRSLDEVLADDTVDIVHNCTPNHAHHAITSAAIAAGKHVLSEKPLGLDTREAADLSERASAVELVTGVCFTYRHFPLIQHLRQVIGSGAGGPVHLIHGGYLQDWLLFENDWNWRIESEKAGRTRAVGDIGSHWIDLVQHVTGDEVIAVCAQLARVHAERDRPGEVRTFERGDPGATTRVAIETEDLATILLRFRRGAMGACTISQVSAGRKNALTFELDAARESYRWDQENPNELAIGRRDRSDERVVRDPGLLAPEAAGLVHYPGGHQEGWPDAMRNLIGDFYATARARVTGEQATPIVATFAEALQVARVVEAIVRSDREGAWVDVRSEVTT